MMNSAGQQKRGEDETAKINLKKGDLRMRDPTKKTQNSQQQQT